MKTKKIMSLVLAGGMFFSSGAIMGSRAYGKTTDNLLISTQKNDKNLEKQALDILNKIEKNPNAKDIKEARKILSEINDIGFKVGYTYMLDLCVNKNIDKGISPIDELVKAFEKTQKITYYDATQNLGVSLDGKNLSKEEKNFLEGIIPILNSAKVSIDMNVKSSNNNLKYKAFGVVHVKVMGFNTDVKMWCDVDATKSTPKIISIFEIPESIKGFLPESYKNKKYFVYDLEKLLNNPMFTQGAPKNIDMNNAMNSIMKSSTNFSLKFVERFKDLAKILDAKFDIVSVGDINKIDSKYKNELNKVYNINLNNEKLMSAIKYTLNDKEMVNLMKSFTNDMISLDKESKGKRVTDDEIKKGLDEGIKALEKMNEAVKFDIDGVIGVNKEGYASYNKGSLKISIDSNKISKNIIPEDKNVNLPKTNSKYTLSINFDANLDNINKDKNDISMPKTTKENSLDYGDLLGGMM